MLTFIIIVIIISITVIAITITVTFIVIIIIIIRSALVSLPGTERVDSFPPQCVWPSMGTYREGLENRDLSQT